MDLRGRNRALTSKRYWTHKLTVETSEVSAAESKITSLMKQCVCSW
jgi:hypothetical protein